MDPGWSGRGRAADHGQGRGGPDSPWRRTAATRIDPAAKVVETQSGSTFPYDALVVAAGLELDWNRIPGLADGIGRDGVCSNYAFDYVPYTWECIRAHRSGPALFTHPQTPVKCGGASPKRSWKPSLSTSRRSAAACIG